MGRNCKACYSPRRAELDRAIACEAKPLRQLATEFGLTHFSLMRHRAHVPARLAKAAEAQQASEATTLLARVENAIQRCERIADAAEHKKDWAPAIAAIRELVKALELLGRVRGELDAAKVRVQVMNQQVTINTSDAAMDPDREIADLMFKITNGFSEEKLNYFRQLSCGSSRTVEGQSMLSDGASTG